jgi:hypothetical protein
MKWGFRAWIPRKEHRAQERLTWKADALPTELLPLGCLRSLGTSSDKPNEPWPIPVAGRRGSAGTVGTTLPERITVADHGRFHAQHTVSNYTLSHMSFETDFSSPAVGDPNLGEGCAPLKPYSPSDRAEAVPHQLRKRLPTWRGLAVRPRLQWRKRECGTEAFAELHKLTLSSTPGEPERALSKPEDRSESGNRRAPWREFIVERSSRFPGERQMGHSARRRGSVDFVVLLEALQPVPKTHAPA